MTIENNVFRGLLLSLLCMAATTIYGQQLKAVDLGLTVRWANMNVGADRPEDYGDYFAWGEVTPKKYYGKYSTYKHYDARRFYKYNYVGYRGSVKDNLLRLASDDDAASKRLGKGWRTPTEDEMAELLDTVKCMLAIGELNGTKGIWVKSRAERGDSIFLPMAGYRDYGMYRFFPGTQCYYWTSTLLAVDSLASVMSDDKVGDKVRCAMCLTYSGDDALRVALFERRIGCVIRPVRSVRR